MIRKNGIALIQQGKTEESVKCLLEARDINPQFVEAESKKAEESWNKIMRKTIANATSAKAKELGVS